MTREAELASLLQGSKDRNKTLPSTYAHLPLPGQQYELSSHARQLNSKALHKRSPTQTSTPRRDVPQDRKRKDDRKREVERKVVLPRNQRVPQQPPSSGWDSTPVSAPSLDRVAGAGRYAYSSPAMITATTVQITKSRTQVSTSAST